MAEENSESFLVLVARKAGYGLPTACPRCLSVYLYLRFANVPFQIRVDSSYPDSDLIPYVERGDYVALNNENGGVVEGLKRDGVVDLDSSIPHLHQTDWAPLGAILSTWLADAVSYEVWVASDGSVANEMYFSELPWPIRKTLHWKQSRHFKKLLQISQSDGPQREKEIYRRAADAYEALSKRLGDHAFLLDDRPCSLDAIFLGHALFVLHALPDDSMLRSLIVRHDNVVKYAEKLSLEILYGASSSSQSLPQSPNPSTSTSRRRGSSRWSRSDSKPKEKKEKTEEEKTFRRRAKYFLAAQLISVLVFLTIMGGSGDGDFEVEDDDGDEDMGY